MPNKRAAGKKAVCVYFPNAWYEQLKAEAERLGIPMAQIVQEAVEGRFKPTTKLKSENEQNENKGKKQ
jgi:hypothetical protein